MKLALGTAQFGLDYGINNKTGKICRAEVAAILTRAELAGIDVIDTAHAYGNSEEVIGEYLKKKKSNFKIISKLPRCMSEDVEFFFAATLNRLGVNRLYGYLLHDFTAYIRDRNVFTALGKLKNSKKVDKIGFSLYRVEELEQLIEEKVYFDIVQVPYNLFDRRFEVFFPLLKKMDIEVHVRSVFLQGLFFKAPEELKGVLVAAKDKLVALRALAAQRQIPISELCLHIVTGNEFIDKVVVGIDSLNQLLENIKIFSGGKNLEDMWDVFRDFEIDNEKILLPMNWSF